MNIGLDVTGSSAAHCVFVGGEIPWDHEVADDKGYLPVAIVADQVEALFVPLQPWSLYLRSAWQYKIFKTEMYSTIIKKLQNVLFHALLPNQLQSKKEILLLYDYMKWNKKEDTLVMEFLDSQETFVHAAQYRLFTHKRSSGRVQDTLCSQSSTCWTASSRHVKILQQTNTTLSEKLHV